MPNVKALFEGSKESFGWYMNNVETKVFAEYQEKYLADPKSGACPCFKAGDTFI